MRSSGGARVDADVAAASSRRVAWGRSLVTVSRADVEAVGCSILAALVAILPGMPPDGVVRLADARPPAREILPSTGRAALSPIEKAMDAASRIESDGATIPFLNDPALGP